MLLDYKYMKYLEKTDNGYKIKENIPQKMKKEITEINIMYEKNYGEKLLSN